MERLEAVEIVGNLCQCCLKALDKQIGKRSLASLQIQQTFQDFFGEDVKLCSIRAAALSFDAYLYSSSSSLAMDPFA